MEWALTMLGGGGNPAAWWDVGGERTGHDASGTAADLSTIAQGNDDIGVSVTTTTERQPTRGGRPSRRSRTRRTGSSGCTRAARCSCPGRSGLAPGERWSRTSRDTTVADGPRPGRGRPRDPPVARRPRPLLSAAPPGSVHRHDAARPDGGPGPRLERADQRRLLPPECGARQPRRDVVGPGADAGRLAASTATRSPIAGSSTAIAGARRHGPALPSHDPAAGVGGGSAHRGPLGPPRLRGPLRPPPDRACGCPRRRSTWRPSGCWRTRASATRSLRPGRSTADGVTSIPGVRSGSISATAGRSSR